jgi:hypothetical protein
MLFLILSIEDIDKQCLPNSLCLIICLYEFRVTDIQLIKDRTDYVELGIFRGKV